MFENLNVPSLVLWGEEDRVLHVSSVDKFFQHMPNVEVEVWPNVGHAPMVEVPEKTAQRLMQFWHESQVPFSMAWQ